MRSRIQVLSYEGIPEGDSLWWSAHGEILSDGPFKVTLYGEILNDGPFKKTLW